MSRLIREFSTPLFFSKWDCASAHNASILIVIHAELDRAARSLELRGQEISRPPVGLEAHRIRSVSTELLRHGKAETNDKLHLDSNLQPFYEWSLGRFGQFIDRLAPNSLANIVPKIRN